MDQQRPSTRRHSAPRTRIVWRDGAFTVECTGAGPAIRLCVYYGRHVMADEPVPSVQAAWHRAAEICRDLTVEDADAYEAGSG